MPDQSDLLPTNDDTLAIAGVLCASPSRPGSRDTNEAFERLVRIEPAAGWMVPKGILAWERELSMVTRADATAVAATLRATLPYEQIAPKKYPMAARAAAVAPLVALPTALAIEARAAGIRVHTVGVDRVSSGFFYFAEGGPAEPVRVQGNLVEMLAPSIRPSTTNAEIEALLDGMVDRLVAALSGGVVTELAIELADALPRITRDGTGLVGTDLEAFETSARALAARAVRWAAAARRLAEVLNTSADNAVHAVPLFHDARRDGAPIDVLVGGAVLHLAKRNVWVVTGQPREAEADLSATAISPSLAPPAPSVPPPPAAPVSIPPEPSSAPPTPRVSLPMPEAMFQPDIAPSATAPGPALASSAEVRSSPATPVAESEPVAVAVIPGRIVDVGGPEASAIAVATVPVPAPSVSGLPDALAASERVPETHAIPPEPAEAPAAASVEAPAETGAKSDEPNRPVADAAPTDPSPVAPATAAGTKSDPPPPPPSKRATSSLLPMVRPPTQTVAAVVLALVAITFFLLMKLHLGPFHSGHP